MALSVFDLFSIGIGPSSSHTVGPMRAAVMFRETIAGRIDEVTSLRIELHGSLGATGHGHGTPGAVILGLLGNHPESVDPRAGEADVARVRETRSIEIGGTSIPFDADEDIILHRRHALPTHPNGMIARALNGEAVVEERTYYSVGGGFVVTGDADSEDRIVEDTTPVAHPFNTADELLRLCNETGKSISRIMLENELSWRDETTVKHELLGIWEVMKECVINGIETEGRLPGGLRVPRRAPELYHKLSVEADSADPPSTAAMPPAAMEQADPTSPWHPTSAPEMDAFCLKIMPMAPAVSRNRMTPCSLAPGMKRM